MKKNIYKINLELNKHSNGDTINHASINMPNVSNSDEIVEQNMEVILNLLLF